MTEQTEARPASLRAAYRAAAWAMTDLDVDGDLVGPAGRRHADHVMGRLVGVAEPLQVAGDGVAGKNAVPGDRHDASVDKGKNR
jgi:hypothetical protein